MKLPIANPFDKKTESEYFLTLTLRDEKATAVVFEKIDADVKVIGRGEQPFDKSIEIESEDNLLKVLDAAISDAESTLPSNIESHKTIFGVKEEWVEEGRIKKEFLAKLKKVSDALDLKPVGFLVITEAIAHLLGDEEGAPISAIVAELGDKSVSVSLFKAGKLIETKRSEIHESKPFTVDALLKHFQGAEILPSKIILFNGASDDIAQEFVAFEWSKSLPFLHTPQITPLSPGYDAKAVLFGAATQMGLSIESASLEGVFETDKTLSEVIEKEVVEKPKKIMPEGTLPTEDEPADFFGFVEGSDIAKNAKPEAKIAPERAVEVTSEIPEEVKNETDGKAELPTRAMFLLAGAKTVVGKLIVLGKSAGLFSLSLFRKSPKMMLFPAIFVLLLVFIVFYYLFATHATLTLGVSAKTSEKNEDVVFSGSGGGSNTIQGQFLEDSEDGKKTANTTGSKETGDKAKGTVTIFNNNDSTQSIPAGTKVSTSNGLNFLTDKSVSVASASGDVFSGTKPGTTDVTVTAEKFGTAYNLPSGTKFSVGTSSTIAGKNDNAFSGGTTKKIKVVSKSDLDNLAKTLQKDLESKALDAFKGKVSGDQSILPGFTSEDYAKKSFSKEVDDEADSVSLTASINFKGISYKKSDLIDFAKNSFEKELGPNLKIDENNLNVAVKSTKKQGDNIAANINIKAVLLPKFDDRQLSSDIKGKSIGDAQRRLEGLPKVETVDIKISPSLPLLPKILPFRSGSIVFIIQKNG